MSDLIKPFPRTKSGPNSLLVRMGAVGATLSAEQWSRIKYHIRKLIQRYLVPGTTFRRQPQATMHRLVEAVCRKYPFFRLFQDLWPLREYIEEYLRVHVTQTEWPRLRTVPQAHEQRTGENFIDLSGDTDDEGTMRPNQTSPTRINMEDTPEWASLVVATQPSTANQVRDQHRAERLPGSSNAQREQASPENAADPVVTLLIKQPLKSVQRVRPALWALGINDQADIDSVCCSDIQQRDNWLEAELRRAGTSEGSGDITPLDLFLTKQAFARHENTLKAKGSQNAM